MFDNVLEIQGLEESRKVITPSLIRLLEHRLRHTSVDEVAVLNSRGSGTNNTVAADTVATIPADARGAFHLPPAANKPADLRASWGVLQGSNLARSPI